jgi:hypothetical protein
MMLSALKPSKFIDDGDDHGAHVRTGVAEPEGENRDRQGPI